MSFLQKKLPFLLIIIHIHSILLTFLNLQEKEKPSCIENKNFCKKCSKETNLCEECITQIFSPDSQGGCIAKKSCSPNENYCIKCDSKKELCLKCYNGFFPDENGSCSLIENCSVSSEGECLLCKNTFILVGNEDNSMKICKPENSDDFINCKIINITNGLCSECENNYFLNMGDKKCTEEENCYESLYGSCTKCNKNYYLDTKNKKCKGNIPSINQNLNPDLIHCSKTDEENSNLCIMCQSDYFLSSFDKKCTNIKFCAKTEPGIVSSCIECDQDYFLAKNRYECIYKEENCYQGDKNSGNCTWCIDDYYLDVTDRKCKSNKEEDDLKFCKYFDGKGCVSCDLRYQVGSDGRCSKTYNCAKSEFGICLKCNEGFYLGKKDKKCNSIFGCENSDEFYNCLECSEGFYLNKLNSTCDEINEDNINIFGGCKKSSLDNTYCDECLDGYYLYEKDKLCYNNTNKENYFYKCSKVYENTNNETECKNCIDGYYLDSLDNKCTKIENCALSTNENKCIQCNENYCLDQSKNSCEFNFYLIGTDEENKVYYNCLRTNKDGTKCDKCKENFNVSENGFCVSGDGLCEKKNKEGRCIMCKRIETKEKEGEIVYNVTENYCLNEDFGCVPTLESNCIRCDDSSDFFNCTECDQGYELDDSGCCIENE